MPIVAMMHRTALPAFARTLLLAGLLAAGLGAGLGAGPAAAETRPVVVELYTSQGCSSCLPADALLARLAKRKDVLALSLPITYWDMLGWKDTLASKANTDRQKAYSAAMGRGGVYTPQMIIDGIKDLVGNRDEAVEKAIAARQADLPDVPVSLSLSPGEIRIAVEAGKPAGDATVWLLTVHPRASVKITTGENAGHVVSYRDIVTQIKAVGIWKGKKLSLDLPREGLGREDGLAVLVQQAGVGPVLGASPIVWPEPRHP